MSKLLASDEPLYTVHPDPGMGAKIRMGRFTWRRYRADFTGPPVRVRTFNATVVPAENTPSEALLIPAIREAHKRVRQAVADGGDLIDVLDKLATLRAAAERQRARYVTKHQAKERWREAAHKAEDLPASEVEAVAHHGADALLWGLMRTLALLAACDFVETWYLETGELPSGMDAEAAFKGTTTRYTRCRTLMEAWDSHDGTVSTSGDLWRIVGRDEADATRKAVGRAFDGAEMTMPEDPADIMSDLARLMDAYDAER